MSCSVMLFIGFVGQSYQYLSFGSFLIFVVQEHRRPLVIQVFSCYCHCSAPFACNWRILLISPEYTHAAVCTILSMIAAAWIPPPRRLCQFSRLYCVQKTVEVQSKRHLISSKIKCCLLSVMSFSSHFSRKVYYKPLILPGILGTSISVDNLYSFCCSNNS